MKAGARVLGIAESYTGEESTLAGVLMTGDGRVDDFCFGSCTVGGLDITESIRDLIVRLDREDTRVILVAGVALAWYNIVELDELSKAVVPPVISVSFEASEGLEDAIEKAFAGEQRDVRLDRYRALPPREEIQVAGRTLFVRSPDVSTQRATEIVRTFMHEGTDRPEPLRVANLAARGVDASRT